MFNYIGTPSVSTSLCSINITALNTHITDVVKELLRNETSKMTNIKL